MKNFCLGFLAALSLSLISYILWENHRHVPVVVKQVPVPVPMFQPPAVSPEPAVIHDDTLYPIDSEIQQ
jgi:hypothetical protein